MNEIKLTDRNNNPVYIDRDSIICLEAYTYKPLGIDHFGTIIHIGEMHPIIVIEDIEEIRGIIKYAEN